LYGWDEAVLYTRNPVAVINDTKPPRRFDVWYDETVYRNVTWYEVVDGRLKGGKKETTTRADLIEWDKMGVPGEFLDETLNENGRERKMYSRGSVAQGRIGCRERSFI